MPQPPDIASHAERLQALLDAANKKVSEAKRVAESAAAAVQTVQHEPAVDEFATRLKSAMQPAPIDTSAGTAVGNRGASPNVER